PDEMRFHNGSDETRSMHTTDHSAFDSLTCNLSLLRKRARLGTNNKVAAAQTSRLKEIINPSCTLGVTSDSASTEKPAEMARALVMIAGPVSSTARNSDADVRTPR